VAVNDFYLKNNKVVNAANKGNNIKAFAKDKEKDKGLIVEEVKETAEVSTAVS